MNIKLYINDVLTATASNLTEADVREEAEIWCDELNNVDGPLEITRVELQDADDPRRRFTVARDPSDPEDERFYIIKEIV